MSLFDFAQNVGRQLFDTDDEANKELVPNQTRLIPVKKSRFRSIEQKEATL